MRPFCLCSLEESNVVFAPVSAEPWRLAEVEKRVSEDHTEDSLLFEREWTMASEKSSERLAWL